MTKRFPTSQARTRKQSRELQLTAAFFLIAALAGCAGTKLPASVAGGECRVFERPEYTVKGATQYDQDVVDNFVESGVGGCNWKRPLPRPAGWTTHTVGGKTVPVPAKKRAGIVKRIKERVFAPEAPPPVAIAPIPPKPVDPVDELLGTK